MFSFNITFPISLLATGLRPIPVLFFAILIGAQPALATAELRVKLLQTMPHNSQTFTQGLIYDKGVLTETSGLYGKSFLRRYVAETGETLQEIPLPQEIFAEGIEQIADEFLVLTWRQEILMRYKVKTLKLTRTQCYTGEGWGLTRIKDVLVMSNGSEYLSFRNAQNFAEVKRLSVTLNGQPLAKLNELESDGQFIWANVWKSNTIYKIDPQTGKVEAQVSLHSLVPDLKAHPQQDVLNGIAYVPEKNAFWVTGKFWPTRHLVQFVSP